MAGIPIVDGGLGGASGASGASGGTGGTGPGLSSLPVWRDTPKVSPVPLGEGNPATDAKITFLKPTVASGAAITYTLKKRERYGFWTASTFTLSGSNTLTMSVTGLTPKTTYSFQVTASTTVAGITRSVTSEVSNTITTSGTVTGPVPLPGAATGASGASGQVLLGATAAASPDYTAPTAKYSVRGYTTAEEQPRPTQAGPFGVTGDAISDLNARTEDNIREALNWQLNNAGGWFNASAMICGMLAQNPFIAGMQDFVEWLGRSTGTILGDLLAGIGAFADWIKGVLCCDPEVVGTTPIMILDAIHGFFDTVLANPLVAAFVTWSENIGSSVGNFFYDLLDGASKMFEVFCSLVTTGQLPDFMDGWTPGDNPVEEILNSLVDIIVAFCNNPITGGFAGLVDSSGRIFVDAVMGALEFTGQIFAFFGLTPENITAFLQTTGECLWAILGGVGDFVGKTFVDILNLAGEMFNGFLSLFGPNTILGDVIEGVGGLLGLLGKSVMDGVAGIIDFLGDAINWLWNLFSFLTGGPVNQAGKTISDLITLFTTWAYNIFGGFVAGAGTILSQIASFITGVVTSLIGDPVALITSFFDGAADGLGTLLQNVLGGFAGAIGQTLETLGTWAANLLNFGNIGKVIQDIMGGLLSIIPIAHINKAPQKVNLLSLGQFETISSLEQTEGWTWDSGGNRTGVVGGAAKLNCSVKSGSKVLFSNQNIKVNYGDAIAASAWIKTQSYTGGSSSIILSVVPFAGTVQKPTVVLAYRGASEGTWAELNSETSPFSAWEVPQASSPADQITSIQMRLEVTGNAGFVWFDDLYLYKTGLMQQGLVTDLPAAFGGTIDGLKGLAQGTTVVPSASAATMWDAANSTTLSVTAAAGTATTARDNSQLVVDGIAQTVGGTTGASGQAPSSVKLNFQNFFTTLYGQNTPQSQIKDGAVPPLSATKINRDQLDGTRIPGLPASQINTGQFNDARIPFLNATKINDGKFDGTRIPNLPASQIDSGTFNAGRIPTSEILPTSGSGAMMSRRNTDNTNPAAGAAKLATGFFDYVDRAGTDIECYNSSGQLQNSVGGKTNLRPVFRVTKNGWYMVEICIKINPTFSLGGRIATVLYKSDSINVTASNTTKFKVGADALWVAFTGATVPPIYISGPRYVQSSFIVYLPAGGGVEAGADCEGLGAGVFDATADGSETYFSIALLNRTYA